MRKLGLVLIALAGLSGPTNAQTQCPELMRLRAEAEAAAKPTRGIRALLHCDAYIRLSIAWNDLAKFAGDHREACDISISAIDEIEKRHHEVVRARDNVCTGRRDRPFPAEVILQ